jgi:hypothetical protein
MTIYLAKMDFGNQNYSWLKVKKVFIPSKNQEFIFFIRDKNGVNAWHCGSLPISDSRIIDIK